MVGPTLFTPRLDHPYRVPEGATISADGHTWRRWGDLGNLYQMGDVVHTLHLMLGIDDINPDQLILMPRLSGHIDRMKVEEWPARYMSNGISVLEDLSMEMSMDREKREILFFLESPKNIDDGKIRLGPLPLGTKGVVIWQNGEQLPFEQCQSGDSDWLWIQIGGEKTTSYTFKVKYESR